MVTQSITDVLDNVNPDLSDSEYIEQEAPLDAPTPAVSDMGETQQGDVGEPDEDEEPEENESEPEQEGDIDEELAAELDMALGDDMEEGGADEEEEEEEDSDEDDDDDDDDEELQARHLLSEEIRDLEAAVAKKQNEIASSSNPLIRVCFTHLRLFLNANLILAETLRGCFEKADRRSGNETHPERRTQRKTKDEAARHRSRRWRLRWRPSRRE